MASRPDVAERNRSRRRPPGTEAKCVSAGCTEVAVCRHLCKGHYSVRYYKERTDTDTDFREREQARQREGRRARYETMAPDAKDAFRLKQRQRKTGWTPEMIVAAQTRQVCQCAICDRALSAGRGTQCDHYETLAGARVRTGTKGATKHPRGLLCAACNSGLGHYEAENGQRDAGLTIPCYEDYRAQYGG